MELSLDCLMADFSGVEPSVYTTIPSVTSDVCYLSLKLAIRHMSTQLQLFLEPTVIRRCQKFPVTFDNCT
jgi:hypothetical protein